MSYAREVVNSIAAELPDCEPDLCRLYALLALTHGAATTAKHVHDAWAVWRDLTRPDHKSIVPFEQLSPEVAALDDPYVAAIHRVAARYAPLAVSEGP